MQHPIQWRFPFRFLLGGMALVIFSNPCWALTAQQRQTMQFAAQQARQICLKEMHHDTDEFVACVDTMRAEQKSSQEKQLGIAYLGLVGCLSAARISTLHSDICSRDYLSVTDRLMRQLNVNDSELCAVVPGDCNMRIQQLKSMRAPAKVPKRE